MHKKGDIVWVSTSFNSTSLMKTKILRRVKGEYYVEGRSLRIHSSRVFKTKKEGYLFLAEKKLKDALFRLEAVKANLNRNIKDIKNSIKQTQRMAKKIEKLK